MATKVSLCKEATGESVQGAFVPSTTYKISMVSGESKGITSNLDSPIVRVLATTDCHIKFGSTTVSGEASVDDLRVPKDTPEYFHRGSHVRVAAKTIDVHGYSGELFVTEMG